MPGAASRGSSVETSDWIEQAVRPRIPATATLKAAGESARIIQPAAAHTAAAAPCSASSSQASLPRIPIEGSADSNSTANVPGTQINR